MVRYPHTFGYYAKTGSFTKGEYIPGAAGEEVPFEGRIVFKPQIVENADGSMSQVEGKIHCKPLESTVKKGDIIKYGQRSLTVFQVQPNQLAWVIWVQ